MSQSTARVVARENDDAGPVGIMDVRGARVRVPLLLTPDASIGDWLLIDAGVAVALLEISGQRQQQERKI